MREVPLTDVDGSPLFYDPGSAGVTTGLTRAGSRWRRGTDRAG